MKSNTPVYFISKNSYYISQLTMVLLIICIIASIGIGVANAAIITVDDSGGADYTTIQDAVNASNNGDTITVAPGIYTENVDVTKSVNLIGAGADITIVNSVSSNNIVFDVTVDAVNISGFTITGATLGTGVNLRSDYSIVENTNISNNQRGILQYSSNYNAILNNSISNNNNGIHLRSSSNNTLSGNTITLNSYGIMLEESSRYNNITNNNVINNYDGIRLAGYSSYNIISNNSANSNDQSGISITGNSNNVFDNTANSNFYGIRLFHSINNRLNNNTMENNVYNFDISGDEVLHFENDIDTTNTVDGKPIYYLVSVSDMVIDASTNAGYVGFVSSDNVTVRGLRLTNNGQGALFVNTSNSSILNINVSDNQLGIYLALSRYGNLIANNNADSNYEGIGLVTSCNNTISNNNASNNTFGIALRQYSNNNTLADNNVSNNAAGISLSYYNNNNTIVNNYASNNNGHGISLLSYNNYNILKYNIASLNTEGIFLKSSTNNIIANNDASNNQQDGIGLEFSYYNTLINNTVNFNDHHGIALPWYSHYNTLINNTANWNYDGISTVSGDNNIILNNTANFNKYCGIIASNNNIVTNNTANSNEFGIRLYRSNNNSLNNNTMESNVYNFYIFGDEILDFENDIDTTNTVDGKPVYYLVNVSDMVIGASTNAGYVGIVNSVNVTVMDLTLTQNGQGVLLANTTNSSILNINASNNRIGIDIFASGNNNIYNNYFNNIFNADFSTNHFPVYSNYWNTTKTPAINIVGGPFLGGNFWGNNRGTGFSQTCTDTNNDGICDSSYTVESENVDYLPLKMYAVYDSEAPTTTIALSGTNGINDWYISEVEVTLTAIDDEGGSGVANTEYSLDGMNWISYSVPFLVSDEGITTVYYHSTDNSGNIEQTKEQIIKIDTIVPYISIVSPLDGALLNTHIVDVTGIASDTGSGLSNVKIKVDEGSFAPATDNGISWIFTTPSLFDGIHTIIAEVTDEAGNIQEGAISITIDTAGPITSNLIVHPNPVKINTNIILTAIIDDTNMGGSNIESVEYSLDQVNWYQMTPMDGSFDNPIEGANTTFTVDKQGVYNLCVQGMDIVGNIGLEECILLVVYDPDEGFVTGGGWIDSPPGAYMPDHPDYIDISGKANFGFVSKYKKGSEAPIGQTEFQFEEAGLNFHSDSYEWLIIEDSKAQYKGTGTINGKSNYGFILTAIDNDPDKFRIKIWEITDDDITEENIVYDNKPETSDMVDDFTELSGGSIVIHQDQTE